METEITKSDIRELMVEAGNAGDTEQVRLCKEALDSPYGPAWEMCEDVILEAQARIT